MTDLMAVYAYTTVLAIENSIIVVEGIGVVVNIIVTALLVTSLSMNIEESQSVKILPKMYVLPGIFSRLKSNLHIAVTA